MPNQPNTITPDEELKVEVKATALRPLADKFQEITRQIDSGDFDLPKTMEESQKITEGYIEQAWERVEQKLKDYIAKRDAYVIGDDELDYRPNVDIPGEDRNKRVRNSLREQQRQRAKQWDEGKL